MVQSQLAPYLRVLSMLGVALAVLVAVAFLVRPGAPGFPDRPPTPSAPPRDDPEGFASWLTESRGVEGGLPVNSYVAAEQAIRDAIARQNEDDSDRGQVLAGLGAVARPWIWLGPSNWGGRTRAFTVSAADPNIMLAAGITGGIWRSENAGASWTPLTDTFSNISVGVIEVDPADPNVMYAGTGEAYQAHNEWYRGDGMMKSTDGGVSWAFLPSTLGKAEFAYVGDIEVSHSDPNRIYAATTSGVWLSTDGGRSWGSAPVLADDAFGDVGCLDLHLRPASSPDMLFAACGHEKSESGGRVFVSTQGGIAGSWSQVPIAASTGPVGRIILALAPTDPDIVYASVSTRAGNAEGLYRSTRGGVKDSWQRINSTPNWYGYCSHPTFDGQGGYVGAIGVDPTDSNRIWLGGIDLYRSEDGGATIELASGWNYDPGDAPYVHADQHAVVFHPDYDGDTNTTVYFANDGGLFRTFDDRGALRHGDSCAVSGVTFETMNEGYGVSQFVGGSMSVDGDIIVAGTQDNGTFQLDDRGAETEWRSIRGGDGGHSVVAPNGTWRLASYTYADFWLFVGETRYTDAGAGITDVGPEQLLFYPPIEADPSNSSVLWSGGVHIWRTTNAGTPGMRWSAVSGALSRRVGDRLDDSVVSAIAVAPTDGDVVYVGTHDGSLHKSTNALEESPTWADADPRDVLPRAYVGGVSVSPADPDIAFVGIQSFTGNQLWRTTDGGANWYSVDASLPEVPVNTIAFNPLNPQMVYAGTDAGVFESLDGGDSWRVANENLATTIVSRLIFRAGTSELFAFTFGRGAYTVDVGDRTPPAHDLLDSATNVVLAPNFADRVDVRAASIDASDPALSCGSPLLRTQTRSVWYRFEPGERMRVAVDTAGSNYDTVLAVFSRPSGSDTLQELACNDDSIAAAPDSEIVFEALPGVTYFIQVTRSAASPADSLASSLVLNLRRL